jgi:TonB-linked SusC/RagA family outer membrane protein
MRKIPFLLAFLALLGMQVHAQRQITGTVTHAEDGSSIPGVSVFAQGTTVGTVTDINGKYTLPVPENAKVLVFSFVGMQAVEVAIGNQTVIDVKMQPAATAIEGVVVTALGITREKKALGYAVQDVKGDELNQSRQANIMNALSGRVAGLQVTSASGNMGGSSRVLIRGVSSLTGNNNPLYVIDGVPLDNSDFNTYTTARGAGGYDYGNMAQDINADDIEAVTVLKGPSAAALYGSRAANGVIMITTKKGQMTKGKKAIGVQLNSSVAFDQVAYQPKRQKIYGGGWINTGAGTQDGFITQDINGSTYLLPDYGLDESWGPKYDPTVQVLPYWSLYDWEALGKPGGDHKLETTPWVYPANDLTTFFETGVAYTNNVALTGGNETGQFRLSYTNMTSTGYMPNSELDRNTVNFSATNKFGKNLEAFISANYIKTTALGRPEVGYGDNNVLMRMNQWGQNQLDMEKMKDYMNPDGTQRTWNRLSWDDPAPHYSDNYYWTRYKNYQNDARDRYYGNAGLTYHILDWLKVTGKYNMDAYTFRIQERVATGSQALSSYMEELRQSVETNAEFLLQAEKRLSEDFRLNATLGGNRMTRTFYLNGGITSGGLVIPDFFSLGNSLSTAISRDYESKKHINSLYASASVDYRSILFLDATGRFDWSSTLPIEENPYFYPSVTGTFVFSDLPAMSDYNWLTFGKLRAGWASVGNDTDPYRIITLPTGANNFGSDIRYSLPGELNNLNLRPEKIDGWEVGAELKFFNNRLGLDFTFYNKTTSDLIFAVPISAASGFTSAVMNAGKMSNKGIELMLTATPVKYNNFRWDVILNFGKNTNEVLELIDDVESLRLGSGPFQATIEARVGEAYGQIVATDFVYDANGRKVVDKSGRYLKTTAVQSLGSVLPDWNAGITNAFSWKGLQVSALIDIQKGGKYFSTTHMFGTYSGILEHTAMLNHLGNNIRDAVEKNADGTYAATSGGILLDGVYGILNTDGTVSYINADGTPADASVENATMIAGTRWAFDHYSRPAAQSVFDATYIKLREVRIGYKIPGKFTGPLQDLTISIYGRNLAIWGRDNENLDPEFSSSAGNIQGLEGGQLPSLRTFGFNLSCNF